MSVVLSVETFLKTKLNVAGVTALVPASRHFADVVRQNATLPSIVFQQLTADDEMINADTIAYTTLIYLVKAVGAGEDKATVDAIASAAHTALQDASGTQDGLQIDVHRIAPFTLPVVDGGTHYRQVGGTYRVIARPSL